MKTRWFGGLALFVTLLGGPTPVVKADDESDIRDRVGRINDALVRIKDDLYGLQENRSSSAIDRVRGVTEQAKQVREWARELAGKHPSSEPARTMAERYPDSVERFLRAAEVLMEMTKTHVRQYESSLDRRCDDAEGKLKDEVGRYLDHNDPEGLQKIPEYAEQLGAPLQRELEEADRLRSNMSSWKSAARDFSESHERWSDVRERLHSVSEAIYSRWDQSREEAHHRCDELAKQRQHRRVQEALTRLGQNANTREQLMREMDEYLERIAGLLRELPERHDESGITTAVELADKLSDALNKLGYAKGKERRAEEIVNRWPSYLERYRSSAQALKKLKEYQYTLDHAPEVCANRKSALLGILALSEIGKGQEAKSLATEIGDNISERLRQADQAKSQIERLRDEAQHISIDDGKWRKVSGNLSEAASRIYSYWTQALTKAHDICGQLALGLNSSCMREGMAISQETRRMSDCTVPEHDVLQGDVIGKCKPGTSTKCGTTNDCGEMRMRLELAERCKVSRERINKVCFAEGDPGHKKSVEQVVTIIEDCKSRIANPRYRCQ